MASTFAENALKEFDVTLDDLGDSLEFSEASRKLRPRLRDFLNWGEMGAEARGLVGKYFKHTAAEPTPFYRGIVMILAGAFEQLVRNLVREAVLNISGSVTSYDALTEGIKRENVRRTGQALTTIIEPLDHLEFDYYELCKNLGTCVPGSEGFKLNAEVFSIFISSVGPLHLVDAMGRVGVNLNWDNLGSDLGLQRFFDRRDARDTSKDIQAFLKDFIKKRNKLAHTGTGGITFSAEDIEGFLKFFRLFSKRLAQVLQQKLKQNAKR